MRQNYLDLINNTAIFGGIRPDTMQSMLKHAKIIERNKDQYFFEENDIADSMFVLLDGQVEIQKNWQNKSYHITHLLAGDCFGEMAIIDHCARSASVLALCPCEAIELNIECFNNIYSADIKQYTMLQMNMGREVSRRLRQANDLLFQSRIENDLKDDIYTHSVWDLGVTACPIFPANHFETLAFIQSIKDEACQKLSNPRLYAVK